MTCAPCIRSLWYWLRFRICGCLRRKTVITLHTTPRRNPGRREANAVADDKAHKQVSAAKKTPGKSAKICEHMSYSAREAFKRLRTNVMISLGEKTDKSNIIVGITSAQPSEGKSTVAINLSYTLAELGKSVILLDCDLRRPSIHGNIGFPLFRLFFIHTDASFPRFLHLLYHICSCFSIKKDEEFIFVLGCLIRDPPPDSICGKEARYIARPPNTQDPIRYALRHGSP